jgi:hypothetical protein
MLCAPELIFGCTDGVRSHFRVLRSRKRFRRCVGRRVPFLCFACVNSFSAVLSASAPIFMFYAPGLVFGGAKRVGSRFHVLRSRTRFRRFRGRRVPFSCFALPGSFSAVPRASGPVFMFCALEQVFGGSEGVQSRFLFLLFRTHFRRYQGHRVPFSSFAHPNSFSAVSTASAPVFMFCAHEHVFAGAEGVGSCFLVSRDRTHFRPDRRRPLPFSCFALTDTFSTMWTASGPIFMYCALGHVFGGAKGVGSRFHVLCSRTRFRRIRGRRVPFSYFAPTDSLSAVPRVSGPVFIFLLPDTFSAVARASGPIILFCVPVLIFGGSEGEDSRFLFLRSRTHFRRF